MLVAPSSSGTVDYAETRSRRGARGGKRAGIPNGNCVWRARNCPERGRGGLACYDRSRRSPKGFRVRAFQALLAGTSSLYERSCGFSAGSRAASSSCIYRRRPRQDTRRNAARQPPVAWRSSDSVAACRFAGHACREIRHGGGCPASRRPGNSRFLAEFHSAW